MSFYSGLVRPLLFALEPETAHHLALGLLERFPPFIPRQKILQPRMVFGVDFPNPIGLAAGFDKNAVALPAWEALGFGFVEIGTVTARAQPGNPRPRIFRYPAQEALINRLGFNNDGAEVIAERLGKLRARGGWPRIPVGINLGKSKVTELRDAPEDYLYSFRRLREFADYVVLNVSSPNTPGLRSLQERDALEALLGAVQGENAARTPLLLKIAPDLSDDDLADIVRLCETHELAGLIATNTTLDHRAIAPAQDETGGLSGPPLRARATDFVRKIARATRLPVIGVGGIADGASAREKFEAGAQLIQLYTGFIYRGPGLLREIAETLAARSR